ncbi:class I SAM-dependent methyltransferase [Aquihabitans daechungensis]|uniref:class I SAM-dependent methyltransferase n=1 Tax=Aquihabitans daechungensis TaxID=1052257 RepID=UPI003B9DE6A5
MTTRDHGFEDLADHLGAAYLRYSFTKGTGQEVRFLVEALGLEPGMRVLDVGCGPGRHAHALGALGIEVHGIDISRRFIDLAREDAPDGVTFERLDARSLPFEREFDAAISLCQGAFGLADWGEEVAAVDPDVDVLQGIARALRPGGRAAVTAFSAYFQVRHVEAMGSEFHARRGVNHERTTIKDEQGRDAEADLWTTCFTPRELRLMAGQAGLTVEHIWSVTPGGYSRDEPTLDSEEFLLVATKERPPPPGHL